VTTGDFSSKRLVRVRDVLERHVDAADVPGAVDVSHRRQCDGVLIARATGMSFGDALRERICESSGMKDTAFSVSGENLSRLAIAYQRDDATGEIVVEDGPDGCGASRRRSKKVAAGSSRPPTISSPSPQPCSPAVQATVSGCCRGRQ
jgi:Beta-lactamase